MYLHVDIMLLIVRFINDLNNIIDLCFAFLVQFDKSIILLMCTCIRKEPTSYLIAKNI